MADHIQIGDISPRIQYTGDGTQTVFTYPFPIFQDTDIEVYEDSTVKVLTTEYSVAGTGASTGGTVTFITAPANGATVTLRRHIAIARTSDFQESGEFRAKVINDELDTLTAGLQQVETDLGRSLRLGPTDGYDTTMEIPDKASRASKVLAFDANGDPVVSTKDLGVLESEADSAAASATASATSATAAATSETNAASSVTSAAGSATASSVSASSAAASATVAQSAASAGLYKQIIDKSGAYTIVVTDQGALIQVDTSGGAVTITLEALATLAEDFRIGVAKMTGDVNTVTVQISGTDTINGGTSIVLSNQYEIYNFIGDLSDGAWLAGDATITSLIGGDGVDKTVNTLSVDLDSNPGLEFNAGKIRSKAGTNLVLSASGIDAPTTASQAEAEAGTGTAERIFTPERVKQAINALASGGGMKSMQVFTASGTWNKPAGITLIKVIVTGAGGGGGSAGTGGVRSGGGGMGGGTSMKIIDVSALSSVSVTVGSGGTGGVKTTGDGTAGGTSSFGAHCSATGGGGGYDSVTTSTTRTVGVGSGGDINLSGDGGGNSSSASGYGKTGGGSYWGGGAQGTGATVGVTGYHGGGGSGARENTDGGPGGAGIVVVEEYA